MTRPLFSARDALVESPNGAWHHDGWLEVQPKPGVQGLCFLIDNAESYGSEVLLDKRQVEELHKALSEWLAVESPPRQRWLTGFPFDSTKR